MQQPAQRKDEKGFESSPIETHPPKESNDIVNGKCNFLFQKDTAVAPPKENVPKVEAKSTPIRRQLTDEQHNMVQTVVHFLRSHTAYDCLPPSGEIAVLNSNMPICLAFDCLRSQGK